MILFDIDYGYDDDIKYKNKIDNLKVNGEKFNKNKNKNFKVLKLGLETILLGATIGAAISSFNFLRGIGFKPIAYSTDTYKTTKVIETNYTKDGTSKDEYYKRDVKDSEILSIKTPYEIVDNSFKRQVFEFNTTNLSNLEKEFIKANIKNQSELLNQDFINTYIENTKKLNTKNVEYAPYTNEDFIYSDDNNYELSYTSYVNDNNDIKNQEIGDYANFVNITNSAFTLLYLSLFGTPLIRSIKKEVKQKRK